MVSPSPYCSRIFRSAFGYDGPMLEIGYPRNDVLVRDDGDRRRQVRQRLGLADDDQVVLYAPTWREYLGVRTSKPVYVDVERLTSALPDAVLLVRGHYNSTGQRDLFEGDERVHDVTRYPDVADLFLAADALVTDYSSVMFDFVLTDRPVVLLVPDLEQYRDVERGFYFDIESRAPGPLVTTTDEVVEVLRGPDEHAGGTGGVPRGVLPVRRRAGLSARCRRPAGALVRTRSAGRSAPSPCGCTRRCRARAQAPRRRGTARARRRRP